MIILPCFDRTGESGTDGSSVPQASGQVMDIQPAGGVFRRYVPAGRLLRVLFYNEYRGLKPPDLT